jgi:hypothetical protein
MMPRFWSAPTRLALLLAALWSGTAAALPPEKLTVTYEVTYRGIMTAVVGEVTEQLRHGGGKYEIQETTKGRGVMALKGTISRSSRGSVAADGLRPAEFVDERSGRQTARVWFDWAANKMTMQFREGPEVQPMPPNAQDRLSFILNFAFAPPGDKPVRMSVADGGSVSRYTFAVVGRERLKVPAGEFDTVRVARLKDGPEDRRTSEMWLAPAHGYIPVRMLATEKDGSQLDQVAAKISGD